MNLLPNFSRTACSSENSEVNDYLRSREQLAARLLLPLWAFLLQKLILKIYIRVKVEGDLLSQLKTHPRLIMLSQHSSHLDGPTILSAIPYQDWRHVHIGAARDYFFTNAFKSIFFKHCIRTFPINRTGDRKQTLSFGLGLLRSSEPVWMILFPEGGRAERAVVRAFKPGASIFAIKTGTPLLFFYLEDRQALWPKGQILPRAGFLTLHIGPVQAPAPIEEIECNYRSWVRQLAL